MVPNFGGHVCRGNMSKYLSPSPEYFILSSCRRSLTTHVAQKTCEYCTNSVCPQKGLPSIINRFTSTATSMPTFAFKYSPRAKKIQKSKNLERSYILVINFCFLFFFFWLVVSENLYSRGWCINLLIKWDRLARYPCFWYVSLRRLLRGERKRINILRKRTSNAEIINTPMFNCSKIYNIIEM